MKLFVSWIPLWCVCALLGGVCRGQQKIAISELLDLKTRTRALQEFVLRTDRNAEIHGWKDLAKFAHDHEDIGVFVSADRREKKKRYVVTWKERSRPYESPGFAQERYSEAEFDRLFPPLGPPGLIFPNELVFSIFEENGTLDEDASNSMLTGFIMDLNGDGEVEVMEASASGSARYVMVRQLNSPPPLFAVAYEWGDLRDHGKAWGYAIRKGDGETYDILFGPKEMDTITPEVAFRWDAQRKTWACDNPGDHLRVLGLKNKLGLTNVWDEINRLGGGVPADIPVPANGGSGLLNPSDSVLSAGKLEKIPALPPSLPYRYESLASLGNAELLAWMGQGRGVSDGKVSGVWPGAPPDFWNVDPKTATLEFVSRNRPKDTAQSYRLAIDDLDGLGAPQEGTLAVSTYWVPSLYRIISEEYFLRCSRNDSYLTVVRKGGPWDEKEPLHPEFAGDLRKIPLTYEEARHVVQTTWWLDRVRSKEVGEVRGFGSIGSGAFYPAASFQLTTPQGAIQFRGGRYLGYIGGSMGVAQTDDSYDRGACLNLVALLMCGELPKYLGDRWTRFDLRKRQPIEGAPQLDKGYTEKQLDDLKAGVAEQLRLFTSGGLGEAAATQVVAIAKDLELVSLRPNLEKMAALLPAPQARENRLREIAREVFDWRQRLGPDETDEVGASRRGDMERSQVDPKYGPLDALYEERDRVLRELSLEQGETLALRDQIEVTLRWFSIENDPQKLFEFATEDISLVFAGCRRLRALDPARAISALEYWKALVRDPDETQKLLQVIDEIQTEMSGEKADANAAETRAILRVARLPRAANAETQMRGLIATIADAKRYTDDRLKAMELLIPANNPRKFQDPAVDDFLANLLDRKDEAEDLRRVACRALAWRGGGRCWEIIASKAGKQPGDLFNLLPGLVTIAVKEGEPFRTRLRDLIAPNLAQTNGGLDNILWAAWMADLRDLKPEIEKLATSNPADEEGELGEIRRTEMSKAPGRFHAARHIASLWNEEDRTTRAKMLIALGIGQRKGYGGISFGVDPGAECLRSALAREVEGLTSEQRKGVVDFVDWCAGDVESIASSSDDVVSEWVSKVKECLGKSSK